jgi:hypothetical protein
LCNPHRLLCLHNLAVTNDSSSLRFIDSTETEKSEIWPCGSAPDPKAKLL